jgi:nucleoside-diphosphate-sugar epimerase
MNQKMNRLLITGASSDLLSRLIALIDLEKYTIRAISRDARNRSGSRHEWMIGDISDAHFVHKAMEGIDVVIHGAAVTHGSKREYIEANVRGTETLVDEAMQAEVNDLFSSVRARQESARVRMDIQSSLRKSM